eukprot:6321249-Amphidinium_carterae.3
MKSQSKLRSPFIQGEETCEEVLKVQAAVTKATNVSLEMAYKKRMGFPMALNSRWFIGVDAWDSDVVHPVLEVEAASRLWLNHHAGPRLAETSNIEPGAT